jgi:hypothetical protein
MSMVSPLRSRSFAYGSEWYEISDEYDQSVTGFTGNIEYYGYMNSTGAWIIQQHIITAGTWRYAQGSSGYATAFTAAVAGGLSWAYYNTLSGAGR